VQTLSFAPRLLHPGAWWLWALGLAVAASRTTNPLILMLIAAVAGLVVAERRVPGPWGRSYSAYLKLGLVIIALRMLLEIVMGAGDIGSVLFRTPEIPLPDWLAGVRLGGIVTADGLLLAVYEGLRLAVMLLCVGAANSLVNPSRLLRIVPAALYEVGVAVVVCLTFAPMLVTDAQRILAARRLRGRSSRGPRAWAQMAMPLFASALDGSIELAASMDSRGYGRTTGISARARVLNASLVLVGLSGVAIGLYGLLQGAAPGLAGVPTLGWPMLVVGLVMAVAGVTLSGKRVSRTRYRPDSWGLPETIVAVSGLTPAITFIWIGQSASLLGGASPPSLPTLAFLPFAAVLVAVLPAFVSPRLPSQVRVPEAVPA
jgi:energy-coupling factor transport system permease protein